MISNNANQFYFKYKIKTLSFRYILAKQRVGILDYITNPLQLVCPVAPGTSNSIKVLYDAY